MRTLLAGAVLVSSLVHAAPLDAAPPPPPPNVTAPASPVSTESRWPGAHAFGLRAGLGGGTATPGVDVGNVGVKFLLTDSIALSGDFGIGLSSGGGASSASFAVDAVASIYFRGIEHDLRPYIPLLFGLGFGSQQAQPVYSATGLLLNPGQNTGSFQVALGGGIGAEYFFAKSFSLAADLLVRLLVTSSQPLTFNIGTLTPGIHATYWF
jgi:hypothetical protein